MNSEENQNKRVIISCHDLVKFSVNSPTLPWKIRSRNKGALFPGRCRIIAALYNRRPQPLSSAQAKPNTLTTGAPLVVAKPRSSPPLPSRSEELRAQRETWCLYLPKSSHPSLEMLRRRPSPPSRSHICPSQTRVAAEKRRRGPGCKYRPFIDFGGRRLPSKVTADKPRTSGLQPLLSSVEPDPTTSLERQNRQEFSTGAGRAEQGVIFPKLFQST